MFVAVGREAARRSLDERPFDVQLVGTLALLAGHVVEMATGEGKTLAGAIAAAGYAVQGRRVHVMTVNDYLATRDAAWMGRCLRPARRTRSPPSSSTSTREERREAYVADVVYGSVAELGFDVLRDRLARSGRRGGHPAAGRAARRRGRLRARRRGPAAARAGRRRREPARRAGAGRDRPRPRAPTRTTRCSTTAATSC